MTRCLAPHIRPPMRRWCAPLRCPGNRAPAAVRRVQGPVASFGGDPGSPAMSQRSLLLLFEIAATQLTVARHGAVGPRFCVPVEEVSQVTSWFPILENQQQRNYGKRHAILQQAGHLPAYEMADGIHDRRHPENYE